MAEELKLVVSELEALLGMKIESMEHFETALTHRSFANESQMQVSDNERYEFLGDAVLQLVVSDWLMRTYPKMREGMLSKYRSTIVKADTLAAAAKQMDLGRFLRLGKGEELTQGREKESLLANAFEAILAAVYLSNGLSAAEEFVMKFLAVPMANVRGHSERHDYKTRLQELTQKLHKTTPVYQLQSEEGPDHEKNFESVVMIDSKPYGRGRSKSKKDSEQRAAEQALQLLQSEMAETETKESN